MMKVLAYSWRWFVVMIDRFHRLRRFSVVFLALLALSAPLHAEDQDKLPGEHAAPNDSSYPPASLCHSADLPPGYPLPPPGHWFNPDRVGQGWAIHRWQENSGEVRIKIIWFTYHPDVVDTQGQPFQDGRPLWLETDPAPFDAQRRWVGTLYKPTRNGARVPWGEVRLQVTTNATRVAMRWTRNDINDYPPLPGNPNPSFVDECIVDIFRGVDDFIDEVDGNRSSLMYSGVWEEEVNPNGRKIVIERGHSRDASNNLHHTQLVFPLLFDSFGDPVWLYGQYGPQSGISFPDHIHYSGDAPDLQGRMAYNFLTYPPGPNGRSGPQYKCSDLNACLERLVPPDPGPNVSPYPFALDVNFTNTGPDGPARARFRLGDSDDALLPILRPTTAGNVTYYLRGWRRPPVNGPHDIGIVKLNPFTSVQVDRYQCTVPPDHTTCPIQVSWSGQMYPQVSVWRMNLLGGPAVQISGNVPYGSVEDLLPAGARVRYRLVAGLQSDGSILDETPEVRALGEVPDAPVVELGVPNHDPSFGALPGSPGVSGGAATYEIPIRIAPGRNGMQPSLALVYSSRSGNGIAGMGWSLSGTSSIHRCPQTVAQDLRNTAVAYTIDDRLCLDGRRLMVVSGSYGQAGAVYRTEIDDFARVTQHGASIAPGGPAYFQVEHKGGTIDWYGACAGGSCAGNIGRHTPEGAPGPLTWALVSREDRFGNNVRYEYGIAGHGEFLLQRIRYTGHNSTVGNRRVEFVYENRMPSGAGNDYGASYLAGGLTMQRHRLQRIRAFAPLDQSPGSEARLFHDYRLDYGSAHSSTSQRSLLRGVQECAYSYDASGTPTEFCRQGTQFAWQDAAPSFAFKRLDIPGLPRPQPVVLADGSNEGPAYEALLVQLLQERLGLLGTDSSELDLVDPSLMGAVADNFFEFRPIADLTGDGSVEWLVRLRLDSGILQSYIVRFSSDRSISALHPLTDFSLFGARGVHPPVDINNDGKADLVGTYNGNLAFGFWNGTGFDYTTTNLATETLSAIDGEKIVHVVDFDGDGKPDILAARPAGNTFTVPSHGCAADAHVLALHRNTTAEGAASPITFASTPQPVTCLRRFQLSPASVRYESLERVADFTGNGLPDIFVLRPTSAQSLGERRLERLVLTRSAGAGSVAFEPLDAHSSAFGQDIDQLDLRRPGTSIVRWADINGDGLDDLIIGNFGWQVRLNLGGRLGPRINTRNSLGLRIDGPGESAGQRYGSLIAMADVDGDGRVELLVPTGFALRMCVRRTRTSPGGDEPIWACPEQPQGDPGLPDDVNAIGVHGMYHEGYGSEDRSVYTMTALRFVMIAPNAIELREAAVSGLMSRANPAFVERKWSGDIYGDGLPDFAFQIGYEYKEPPVLVLQEPWGPNTLPNGDPTAQFANAMNRQVYIVENRGACAGVANPRCHSANLPPLAPELMHSAVDNQGRTALWNYYPLSSNGGRASDPSTLPFYSRGNYADADHFYFTSSMSVVESFIFSNGVDDEGGHGASHNEYSYREAMYNNKGRGFQGFRAIVEDVYPDDDPQAAPTSLRTTTTFHQKFPLTGLAECSEVRTTAEDPFTSLQQPIERSRNHWVWLETAPARRHPYVKQSSRWLADPDTRVVHTTIIEMIGNQASVSGSGCAQTMTSWAHDGIDAYGNLTRRATNTVDTFASKLHSQDHQYAAPNLAQWWIDRRTQTVDSAIVNWNATMGPVPAPSTHQANQSNFEYLEVTRALHWMAVASLTGDTSTQRTDFHYDAYGNVDRQGSYGTHVDNSQSRRVLTGFDDHGYFPTRMTQVVAPGTAGAGDASPLNHVTQMVTDPRFGEVVRLTDPNGLITSTTLDAWGRAIRVDAPGVQPRHVAVQRCNAIHSCAGVPQAQYRIEQRQNGTPIAVTFLDRLDREVGSEVRGMHGQGNLRTRTLTEYMPRGLVRQRSTPHFVGETPFWTTFGYDRVGRTIRQTLPAPGTSAQRVTQYSYSGLNTSIQATAPQAQIGTLNMTRTYNAAGQLLHTRDALNGQTHYRYDGAGNPVLIEGVDGPSSRITASYNGLGHRLSVQDPDRGNTTFAYNGLGEVRAQWDGVGGRHWLRDRLGRSTSEYEHRPDLGQPGWTLRGTWQWDTRRKGLLSQVRRVSSLDGIERHRRELHYDSLSRPVREDVLIKETAHADQAHDPANAAANPFWLELHWQRSLRYDGNYGWVKQQTQGPLPGSYIFELEAATYSRYWKHDRFGYLVEEGNAFDVSLQNGRFGRRVLAQNAWGQPVHQQLGNQLHDFREYDVRSGQVSGHCVGLSQQQCSQLKLAYGYDGWGNLVSQAQGEPAGSNGGPWAVETFNYDALHRLVHSAQSGSASGLVNYAYHPNGNLRFKSDFSQQLPTAYQYGTRPHAVTQVLHLSGARLCYSYDAAGNQTELRRTNGSCPGGTLERAVTYDVTHRPETIQYLGPPTQKRTVFRYDLDGERFLQRRQALGSPTDATQVTLYPFPGYEVEVRRQGDGAQVLSGRQMLGDYALWTASISDPGGSLIFRHPDRLGSPAAQTDEGGQTQERRGFDPWGAPRNEIWQNTPNGQLGSQFSPRGFTGHEHLDAAGGLIHMNGRAYDPLLGRFLSVDPIIQMPQFSQSLNPYSYIMNNPLAGTDPTGYCASSTTGSRIGTPGNGSLCNLDLPALKDGMGRMQQILVSQGKNLGGGSAGVGASSMPSLGGRVDQTDGSRDSTQSIGILDRASVSRRNSAPSPGGLEHACGSRTSSSATCATPSDLERHRTEGRVDQRDESNPNLRPSVVNGRISIRIPYKTKTASDNDVIAPQITVAKDYWGRLGIDLRFEKTNREEKVLTIRTATYAQIVDAGFACSCQAAGGIMAYTFEDFSEIWLNAAPAGLGDGLVLAHEIGHFLGLQHRDFGIMQRSGEGGDRSPNPIDGVRIFNLYFGTLPMLPIR